MNSKDIQIALGTIEYVQAGLSSGESYSTSEINHLVEKLEDCRSLLNKAPITEHKVIALTKEEELHLRRAIMCYNPKMQAHRRYMSSIYDKIRLSSGGDIYTQEQVLKAMDFARGSDKLDRPDKEILGWV